MRALSSCCFVEFQIRNAEISGCLDVWVGLVFDSRISQLDVFHVLPLTTVHRFVFPSQSGIRKQSHSGCVTPGSTWCCVLAEDLCLRCLGGRAAAPVSGSGVEFWAILSPRTGFPMAAICCRD